MRTTAQFPRVSLYRSTPRVSLFPGHRPRRSPRRISNGCGVVRGVGFLRLIRGPLSLRSTNSANNAHPMRESAYRDPLLPSVTSGGEPPQAPPGRRFAALVSCFRGRGDTFFAAA